MDRPNWILVSLLFLSSGVNTDKTLAASLALARSCALLDGTSFPKWRDGRPQKLMKCECHLDRLHMQMTEDIEQVREEGFTPKVQVLQDGHGVVLGREGANGGAGSIGGSV